MKLAVFVSDYRLAVDTLDKLKAEKLGIILVGNGVYHASVKEGGNSSPLLKTSADSLIKHPTRTWPKCGSDLGYRSLSPALSYLLSTMVT